MSAEPRPEPNLSDRIARTCTLAAGTVRGYLINIDAVVTHETPGVFSLRLLTYLKFRPNKAASLIYTVIISRVEYTDGFARVRGILLHSVSVTCAHNAEPPRSPTIMFDYGLSPITADHQHFIPQAVVNKLAADPLFFIWAKHAAAKELREALVLYARNKIKRRRRCKTWTSPLDAAVDSRVVGGLYLSWVDASDFSVLPSTHWKLQVVRKQKTARGAGWWLADGTPA